MKLSERYPVPSELALLYEFVNTLDLRHFVEQGAPHATGDEIGTPEQLRPWLRGRGLLARGETVSAADHKQPVRLRQALRGLLQAAPEARPGRGDPGRGDLARALSDAAAAYPLVVRASAADGVLLQPAPGASGLGRALAELYRLEEANRLDRLKMCASDECHWVFYDRSKPGNRRWCSSALCGNREKTRTYRERRRTASGA
jgi:predicted RNA-binding Zn ribbon-like protein